MGLKKQKETIIAASSGSFQLDFSELYQYRDLLWLLIRKELSAKFRQTLLGPLWFIVQPVLLTLVYLFLFDRVALVPYGQWPPSLFFLFSVPLWNYFSQSYVAVSEGLVSHVHLLSKVHFPRLIVPLAAILWRLVPLALQLGLFCVLFAAHLYYHAESNPNFSSLLILPTCLLLLTLLSLGLGLLSAAVSVRYKDLHHLSAFLLQVTMFATPVLYPSAAVPANLHRWIDWNPLNGLFEAMRFPFFPTAEFPALALGYSAFVAAGVFLIGLFQFQRVERTCVDQL